MPVWVKWPIVCGVVIGLVLMKKWLLGFMAMFPMVGVVTAYEARHCLWTICRQIPIFTVPMVLMMCTMRLTQERFGMGGALATVWAVFIVLFGGITWMQHSRQMQEK